MSGASAGQLPMYFVFKLLVALGQYDPKTLQTSQQNTTNARSGCIPHLKLQLETCDETFDKPLET